MSIIPGCRFAILAALAVALLFQIPVLRADNIGHRDAQVTFAKWVTTMPGLPGLIANLEGVVGGDVGATTKLFDTGVNLIHGPANAPATVPAIRATTKFQHTTVQRDKGVSFAVTASGIEPITYQWRRDGQDLQNQTNKLLAITAAQPADDGNYTVEISSPGGMVVSPSVRLSVIPPMVEYVQRNFTNAANVRIPYVIHLPTTYDPARRYPLACFIHGSTSNESNLLQRVEPSPHFFAVTSYGQQEVDPVIMVWPTRRVNDSDWSPSVLQQVLDLLDALQAEHSVDAQRIYLAGYSQGVHGVWDLLGLRPGFFAGALVWAGWMGSTPASEIVDVPLWAFHARDDSIVPVSDSQTLIAALRSAGGHPLYSEFNLGDHLGPMTVGSCSPVVLDWWLAQRRGSPGMTGPSLSINRPASGPTLATGASSLDLQGSAATAAGQIAKVTWENGRNRSKGTGLGTADWNITGVPLVADRTNVLVLAAVQDTPWAPALGGTTTFSDTISVFSSPVRLHVTFQGNQAVLNWTGGVPPVTVQSTPTMDPAAWGDLVPNATPPITMPAPSPVQFYRIAGQ